jgi:hypothetical protein
MHDGEQDEENHRVKEIRYIRLYQDIMYAAFKQYNAHIALFLNMPFDTTLI